jgi:hypothetical protein
MWKRSEISPDLLLGICKKRVAKTLLKNAQEKAWAFPFYHTEIVFLSRGSCGRQDPLCRGQKSFLEVPHYAVYFTFWGSFA